MIGNQGAISFSPNARNWNIQPRGPPDGHVKRTEEGTMNVIKADCKTRDYKL